MASYRSSRSARNQDHHLASLPLTILIMAKQDVAPRLSDFRDDFDDRASSICL